MHTDSSCNPQMSKDQWYQDAQGTIRLSITQFHEVVGFFSKPWLQYFAQLMVGISLLGYGVAQVCVVAALLLIWDTLCAIAACDGRIDLCVQDACGCANCSRLP